MQLRPEKILSIIPNITFLAIVVATIVMSMPSFAGNQSSTTGAKPAPMVIALQKQQTVVKRKSSSSDDFNEGNGFRVEKVDDDEDELIGNILKIMLKEIDVNLESDEFSRQFNMATTGQQAIYAVYILQNEVNDSGFGSYFSTEAGNLISQAQDGLAVLGAKSYLRLLNKALVVFSGDEGMIHDASDRRTVLRALSTDEIFDTFEPLDAAFEGLEEESLLQEAMSQYIEKNPKQFYIDP